MRKQSILLIALIMVIQISWAQLDYGFEFSKAGTAGFQFLKIDVGARESAMGGAVTSLVRDANAVFWNPAGIAHVRKIDCVTSVNNWLVKSQLASISLAYPFGSTVMSLNLLNYKIADFEETTVVSSAGTGNMISAGDTQIGLAVARRFTNRLSIGLQLKYNHEYLAEYTNNNWMIDVGSIYITGFRDLTLGFAFQHFGPDMRFAQQQFRTPLLFRIGASDKLIDNEMGSLTLGIDLVHPTDNVEWVNVGFEYKLGEILALRLGYRPQRDLGNVAYGIGLKIPELGSFGSTIDYSYMSYGAIFENIHRVTLGMNL